LGEEVENKVVNNFDAYFKFIKEWIQKLIEKFY